MVERLRFPWLPDIETTRTVSAAYCPIKSPHHGVCRRGASAAHHHLLLFLDSALERVRTVALPMAVFAIMDACIPITTTGTYLPVTEVPTQGPIVPSRAQDGLAGMSLVSSYSAAGVFQLHWRQTAIRFHLFSDVNSQAPKASPGSRDILLTRFKSSSLPSTSPFVHQHHNHSSKFNPLTISFNYQLSIFSLQYPVLVPLTFQHVSSLFPGWLPSLFPWQRRRVHPRC
jgi:hypothetical protein